jgi:hypothetical protein
MHLMMILDLMISSFLLLKKSVELILVLSGFNCDIMYVNSV